MAGVSALAGVVGGAATNIVTSDWNWTWGCALVVTTVVLVVSQAWLSLADGGANITATGTGAVAADTVAARVDIDAVDSAANVPAVNPVPGIHAAGTGSVAARKIKGGPIKIRARRR